MSHRDALWSALRSAEHMRDTADDPKTARYWKWRCNVLHAKLTALSEREAA